MAISSPAVRAARALRLSIQGFALVMVVVGLGALLFPDYVSIRVLKPYASGSDVLGRSLQLAVTILIAVSLCLLERILDHVLRDGLFAGPVERGMRRFAHVATFGVLVYALAPTLLGLVEGRTPMAVYLDIRDLFMLVLCAMFHVIAGVIAEGARLDAENRAII